MDDEELSRLRKDMQRYEDDVVLRRDQFNKVTQDYLAAKLGE